LHYTLLTMKYRSKSHQSFNHQPLLASAPPSQPHHSPVNSTIGLGTPLLWTSHPNYGTFPAQRQTHAQPPQALQQPQGGQRGPANVFLRHNRQDLFPKWVGGGPCPWTCHRDMHNLGLTKYMTKQMREEEMAATDMKEIVAGSFRALNH
jgi:hypothetical protein